MLIARHFDHLPQAVRGAAIATVMVFATSVAWGMVDMVARYPSEVSGIVPADAERGYPGFTYKFALNGQKRLIAFVIRMDSGESLDVLSLAGSEVLKDRAINSSAIGFGWTYNMPGGKIPGEDILVFVRFLPHESCGPHDHHWVHMFRIEESGVTEQMRRCV